MKFLNYLKSVIFRKAFYTYEITKIYEDIPEMSGFSDVWALPYKRIEWFKIHITITEKIIYQKDVYHEETENVVLKFYIPSDKSQGDICFYVETNPVYGNSKELKYYKFAPLTDEICKKAIIDYCNKTNFKFSIDGEAVQELWKDL